MSNTNFSDRSNSELTRYRKVQEFVASRARKKWCLFLDRDGVLNRQIVGDYVRHLEAYEWLPQAIDALNLLSGWPEFIVIVTNQQGIGKGLMSAEDVASIHRHVDASLGGSGGLIKEFLICPHLESAMCECRKPNPGLALNWLQRHPEVEPQQSLVVGDSPTDIEMAIKLGAAVGGCNSVGIGRNSGGRADTTFDSLWEFAVTVQQARKEVE